MKKLFLALTIFTLVLMPLAALAASITVTGTGTFDSLPVSVTATFITRTDQVEVDVYNNIADPRAVIQCLTDIGFVLNTGQTTGTFGAAGTFSVQTRGISGTGSCTTGVATSTHWHLDTNVNYGADGFGLKLNDLGGGQPKNSIVGQDNNNGSGSYNNAEGSIAGNGPHNPFWFGDAAAPVKFFVHVPGVTAASQITFVEFSFGTTAGNNVDVHPPAPIPGSMLLLGSGILGLVGMRRKLK